MFKSVLAVLISVAPLVSYAEDMNIECIGRSKERGNFKVVVKKDHIQIFNHFKAQGVKPEPAITWIPEERTVNARMLSISGRTTGVTTGRGGLIEIRGQIAKRQGNPNFLYYTSEVSIRPQSMRVMPVLTERHEAVCSLAW